jgi:cytochrome c oxidase assembly factor CtaG
LKDFFESHRVWPNSYWCCLLLTLRISLLFFTIIGVFILLWMYIQRALHREFLKSLSTWEEFQRKNEQMGGTECWQTFQSCFLVLQDSWQLVSLKIGFFWFAHPLSQKQRKDFKGEIISCWVLTCRSQVWIL